MSKTEVTDPVPLQESDEEPSVQLLRNALRGLQFGQVTAIVQDGVIVQIERTEKRRLQRKRPNV